MKNQQANQENHHYEKDKEKQKKKTNSKGSKYNSQNNIFLKHTNLYTSGFRTY